MPTTDPSDDDLALLRKFRQLAGRILAEPGFSVDDAAGLLGMSPRSLHRRFKELTGLTPAAYLREHRLYWAKELLETGAVRSVEAAAFAVGIEDAAYFARLFYRRYRLRASALLRP
ncbi:helix-turn-helix transcriptional regulator [Hymenobacter daecheongensis]|uniref:helix-turn-helix transcriptional regulator n=1 Tax=Hymenobacter daecheongensis TaxID=496053 RepID=UPI0009344D7F|nr:helix-turn-helix transcriptional regulator [Hymenobacter daecheongensis]